MVVIDTDVLIAFSKGNEKIIEKIKWLETFDSLAPTMLNAEEFLVGLYFSTEDSINKGKLMLQKFKIYDYTSMELSNVVQVKAMQKKKGTPIGKYDETIAGICLAKNEKLFTLNKKHFGKIDNLQLVDF